MHINHETDKLVGPAILIIFFMHALSIALGGEEKTAGYATIRSAFEIITSVTLLILGCRFQWKPSKFYSEVHMSRMVGFANWVIVALPFIGIAIFVWVTNNPGKYI